MRSGEGLLGHDEVEVFESDFLSVAGCSLEHLLEFLGGHGLSEFLGDSAQVVDVDGAGLVVVEQVEDAVDALLGLLVAQLSSDGVQELVEVNAALVVLSVQVSDHLENSGVLGFEAEGLHGCLQLLRVDETGAVSVEEVEGLSDLLDLVLGKARALESLASDG